MKLDTLIEAYLTLRNEKQDLGKRIREISHDQAELEGAIHKAMAEAGITRAGSTMGMVSVKTTPQPSVVDWAAFQQYIADTGSFDLLQRRLSAPAFRDRWMDGAEVPGTTKVDIAKLHVTKT